MREIKLSKKVFEILLTQLVTIEERRERSGSYGGANENPGEFSGFMDIYERKLKELVESVTLIETENTSVPFVVIGSEVQVCDLDSMEMITCRVTTPEAFEPEGNDVTILSPIGKALLLKEVGDCVDIRAPVGVIHYEITSIGLDSEIDIDSIYSYLA